MTDHPIAEVAKNVGDLISFTTLLATLAQFLPVVASLFTIVWTVIRIYESKTVQRWLRRNERAQ